VRLYFIRHGQTQHNADGLALGRRDVPLNETGRAQAQTLARRLAGAPIEAVYASPLGRALETARPLADALGLEVGVEERLIEMDVGEVEDLPFDELRERYPEFLRRWRSDGLADVPMPGGETLRQVQERAWAAVEALRGRHGDGAVAAVTHNFVILSLLCRVLRLPLDRFRSLRQDVGAYSVVELGPERAYVVSANNRCHLEGEGAG
jgi:broad specificity phosphatase PhoE